MQNLLKPGCHGFHFHETDGLLGGLRGFRKNAISRTFEIILPDTTVWLLNIYICVPQRVKVFGRLCKPARMMIQTPPPPRAFGAKNSSGRVYSFPGLPRQVGTRKGAFQCLGRWQLALHASSAGLVGQASYLKQKNLSATMTGKF